MAEDPLADLAGRSLGEFILREPIGEGGYAIVYRGEQPALQRDLVIKVLHRRRLRSDAARDRFLREAKLASRLDHPYAAHVYAFGAEDDGLMWIAMELVQGVTLAAWLETHGTMPLDQFVPLFECVAQVLQAAHERGIVHRDVKPSNIMVIDRGGHLFPKLLDFGIAKVTSEPAEAPPSASSATSCGTDAVATARIRVVQREVYRTRTDPSEYRLTGTGSGLGSAPYMAPEQWNEAGAVGPAADIYALGILAYEALTGRRPFVAEATNDYHELHVSAEMPPLGGEFPADLVRVLRRALAKDPKARHKDALELASELRAVLRAQPREQLRSLAQMWADSARSPALLLRGRELTRASTDVIGDLERTFIVASRQYAGRRARIWRFLTVAAAILVLGAVWYRGELKTQLAEQRIEMAEQQARSAKQVTEVAITQAELEQGRQALLHNEPEAAQHLAEAYRRDRSPSTAFMLARALEPRLAEQARLTSTYGRMWWAAFSPDGRQLVTTDDRNAQVWDAQTYARMFTLSHGDVVYHAVYSADGTRIITACGDGVIRVWDAANGRLVRTLTHASRRRYGAVAVSRDGKVVAAIDLNGEVAHVWDSGGTVLAELRNDASDFYNLEFSSDDRWLATSGGNDVRVFDARTWAQVCVIAGPGIHGLSWDPKRGSLLTGSIAGDVSIWGIPTCRRTHHLREIGDPVEAVAFAPDGQLVAAATRDGTEQVWNAVSGKLVGQSNHLKSQITSIEFDRTSSAVVAAGASGVVSVIDAFRGLVISRLEGPRNAVFVVRFDPASQKVVAASRDGTARVWNAAPPHRRWRAPPVADDCGLAASLEPDRRFVAVGCREQPTLVWDTARGQLLARLPAVIPTSGDFATAFPAVSESGDRAAIARGATVEVYELPGGRMLQTIDHHAAVSAVAFASHGRELITGAIDGSLIVAHDGGALLVLPTFRSGIDAAGVLPDGRLVAADVRRRLRFYDANGTILADRETSARVRTLRMSSDGRRLITVPSAKGKAAPPELWELEHYGRMAELAKREGNGTVYAARFMSDRRIVTACGDGAARLWDSATGQLRQTYRDGSRFYADATLTSDGSIMVAGGGDGLLRFWDAGSARLMWRMPAHSSHLVGIGVDGDNIVTRGFSGDISRWAVPASEQVLAACSGPERCAIVPE